MMQTRTRIKYYAYQSIVCFFVFAVAAGQAGAIEATDYAQADNWLAVADNPSRPVDVFYLYPTAWQNETGEAKRICPVDDPDMRDNAKAIFQKQATAFAAAGNLFAPFYRQTDAAYALSLDQAGLKEYMGMGPVADVTAAFDYFLENYNQGRPFILAGHSQGASTMLALLGDYLRDRPEVRDRMIAAYVIGYSVTKDFLAQNPHLAFAEGPRDVGVVISWNTEAPGLGDNPVKNPVWLEGSIAINPLTWTRDSTPATQSQNYGSLILDRDGNALLNENGMPIVGPPLANAMVDVERGVVVTTTPDPQQYALPGFPVGSYHSMDIPFYYANIQVNALGRAKAFLQRDKQK